MSKKKWLIVKNKWTYLLLLTIPVGIIKIVFDYNHTMVGLNANMTQFIYDTFISLIIISVGIILFIKFNTHSNWMNPDHPKQ